MSAAHPAGRSAAAGATLLALALLGGCAQAPKPLYAWGNFPRMQYDRLAHTDASPEQHARAMEEHIEKTRAVGQALPPGFRAHLALLQLDLGRPELARSLLAAEREAFPESGPYIDSVIRRLDSGIRKEGAR